MWKFWQKKPLTEEEARATLQREKEDLHEERKLIRSVFDNPSVRGPTLLPIHTKTRLLFVLEELFGHAKQKVCICVERLSADLFGDPDVVGAAEAFLADNPMATISIIAVDRELRSGTRNAVALDALLKHERVSLVAVGREVWKFWDTEFMVVDTSSFWIHKVSGKLQVFSASGYADICARANELFEQFKESA